MNRKRWIVTFALCVIAATLTALPAGAALPPRGSVAPAISLTDLGGEPLSTDKLSGKVLVLIFGELGHEGARQACADTLDAAADPRLSGQAVVPILIVARDAPAAQLKDEAAQGRYPAIILHDPKREAFGAYRVLVIPSVVIVDGKGKVVHSMPGYLQKSKDLLTEAMLTAVGKESPAQFEQSLDPNAQAGPSHEATKADRLVHLGTELTKHGLNDMAEARFKEALSLMPGHVGAILGLGEVMLKQGKLDEAEQFYKSLLVTIPDSVDAALGIAAVQVKRGGADLSKAEASLKTIIDKDGKLPRARFLMGQVREGKGDVPGAMAEYRTAAELLMNR